ncbi:MAG: nitroreductase family protein [Rhodothermales bacterium]
MSESTSHPSARGMTMTLDDPWSVSAHVLPDDLTTEQQCKYLLNFAVLAPSSHNSQPWLFRVTGKEIALYADRTRALPVIDPDDRELIMSCGASLFHLRAALHGFGFSPVVRLFPDFSNRDLLAYIHIGEQTEPDPYWQRLLGAIKHRHTNRSPFERRHVPPHEIEALQEAAAAERTHLAAFASKDDRIPLSVLIAEADLIQSKDKGFRRELAAWMHPNRTKSRDGIPGFAMGISDWLSNAGPSVVRTFDWGSGKAAHDQQLAEGSPALIVLSTASDDAAAWLEAGQALARILLQATDFGLMASFLNQPIEVDDLRPRVAELAGGPPYPQSILRLGYGQPVRPTPRRPVREVMYRSR